MAQELLTTFEHELGEVALVPGTGGVFEVRVDGELLWSRTERGRFPDIKQLVRDRVVREGTRGIRRGKPYHKRGFVAIILYC